VTTPTKIPALRLVGIQRTGPSSFNQSESGSDFAAKLWFEFIDSIQELGIDLGRDMYGVSWPADDQTPPQQVHYFAGFISDENFDGLTALSVPSGNYFDYSCEVPANNLDSGFHDAYVKAMPASGLVPREGLHLEIYGDEYDPTSDIARFRILIPVQ
jgi:predicted transcriptional regulator YdeE